MLRRIAALLALLACLRAEVRAAEEPGFEGAGRAPISAGDRVRARERALDEAFQHVLEAAVTALLGPETRTRKAADLRLKILPRARSYVTSYRVLDEGERDVGFFSVQVSAQVAVDRLTRELSDRPAASAASRASTVILCAATSDGSAATLTRLTQALQVLAAGRGLSATTASGLPPRCEPEALGPIVKQAGARVALTAEVTPAAPAPIRGTTLVGRDVKLALRVIEPDGRRSAEGKAEAAGYGKTAEAATDDAATLAVGEAGAPVEEALGAVGSRSSNGVTARVLGVRRFAQLATVRGVLERLPGVDAVEPRRFQPGAPGAIELMLRTTQPVRALADALGRVAATYQLRARELDGVLVVDVPEALDPVTPETAK